MLRFRIITSLSLLFLSKIVRSSFLVEPKDKIVVRGETVVFKCAVTTDVENVYWYYSFGTSDSWISVNRRIHNTVSSSKIMRYSIIGDASKNEYFLQIRNVSSLDIGDYKCFYYPDKPTLPNRSPEASLVLADPPKTPLCAVRKADTAIPSPIVTMRCTSTGDPTPQVVWLRNGSPIEGNVPRASVNILIWNITKADSGAVFSCIVDSPKMTSPPSCKLTPLKMNPVVSVEPSVQTLALNHSGKFVCESTGIPKPLKYKWFINGEVPSRLIEENVHYRIKHDGKTLKILWVVEELNDAEVTCRVTGRSNIIYYGSAHAYVSNTENEIFLTTTVIPIDENTGESNTNGTIKGNKSSDFINNTGAKGVLDQGKSSNSTVIGVVISLLGLSVFIIVLAVFLYKRNNEIDKSGKRFSAKFMQCVAIRSNSNNESNEGVKKDSTVDSAGETNEMYAIPLKRKTQHDKQYVTQNNENEELAQNFSKPNVLPRLVSKKKENTDNISCTISETTEAHTSVTPNVEYQESTSNDDGIVEINIEREEQCPINESTENESETYKSRSLLRSLVAKLPTEKISAFVNDLRPEKPKRTFLETVRKLRTNIVPQNENKKEDDNSVEDDYAAIKSEENAGASEESMENVIERKEEIQISEIDLEGESDDIPSSLPSEQVAFDQPVVRRHRTLGAGSSVSSSNNPDYSNKRSSLTLDNLLANVKRRSLSRRFSGFENRGSSPDLRISRRFEKNDIVHFVPLGNKGNDMTGNVEVVKNRNSINFENEMSQTLLKSFHTVVPNQPKQTNERIIEDFPSYENLDEKESCTSEGSAYMTDDFSEDEETDAEGKPVERVAPMRIIDDTPVYENTELKPLNAKETLAKTQTEGSVNTTKLDLSNTTKQNKPTMRVKPRPTPRSFRKLNGSNSSSELTPNEHYEDLTSECRKQSTVEDPTTGENIYDNVDYKL
ncbi:uncharacterized protein LOC117120858 [Anneissia japonica]|uniref:uncharacterized protein LOC117120858 n=1 Tax=Anneissia japonica TaxID=1529436 RepID=UPI0014256E45|nr:uncharacterized protein LOC117120858 [Anneissia japonica]XP_033121842.1 uncharacterized protein LOC117120858 [Anneissia japonica]XP_033121843.1 uncharacterized protein LOC117120858 [Anneissia japonica]XP_033121844.1 uncharacterized protein LOC117120858 [Anneissia japonica]